MFEECKLTKCTPLKGYKLKLVFLGGAQGIVDVSRLVGKGVFSLWDDVNEFEKVVIDPTSQDGFLGEWSNRSRSK